MAWIFPFQLSYSSSVVSGLACLAHCLCVRVCVVCRGSLVTTVLLFIHSYGLRPRKESPHTVRKLWSHLAEKTKSSSVRVNLICTAAPCEFADPPAPLRSFKWATESVKRQPWWAKNKNAKNVASLTVWKCVSLTVHSLTAGFFFLSLFSRLKGRAGRAVTDDTTVATSWFLWEAIRVVCLLRAVPG